MMLKVKVMSSSPSIGNLVLLLLLLLKFVNADDKSMIDERRVARDSFENALLHLMHQRRLFIDGFANGTVDALQRYYTFGADDNAAGEGRSRKKLRQMNRALMAIVMGYSLKFMFLIPTFLGTLILLKFTTALAGFFYALFAAVLGLDHHHDG